MKQLIFSLLVLFFLSSSVEAQISTPAPSPTIALSQGFGVGEINVNYSSPGMKGRTIFAKDGLVGFDKVWRTGANAVTNIEFSDDVMIEGQALSAGKYAVLTMPGVSEWGVHFYAYDKSSWSSYKEKEADLIVKVKSQSMPVTFQNFLINFDNMSANEATLQLIWERTLVPISIKTDTDGKVMASIDKVMNGPSNRDYYAAARYYLDSDKDLNKALKWVQIANNTESPKFWQVRTEALILQSLGRTAEAIDAATASKELAEKAGNMEYVKFNETSIMEWSKK